MSKWTLRAILLSSLASLGVNVVILYLALHPRVIANGTGPGLPDSRTDGRANSRTALTPSPLPAASGNGGGRTVFEIIDKASGKRIEATLTDDGTRLSKFVREGRLSAEQEAGLRGRYAERQKRETARAEQMAREGQWRPGELQQIEREFWYGEWKRLPAGQTSGLSPEFYPPPGQ